MADYSAPKDLARFIEEQRAHRIGIDGIEDVGKTTLGRALAARLDYPLISLDSYLRRNQGGFIEYLDYSALSRDLNAATRWVVEGVCLLQALSRVPAAVDVHIYVKRLQHGIWLDERECVVSEDIEAFVADERALVGRIAGTSESEELGLGEEIIRYHHAFQPHNVAHATYVRNDC